MATCEPQTKRNSLAALAVVSALFSIGMCILCAKEINDMLNDPDDINPLGLVGGIFGMVSGFAVCKESLVVRSTVWAPDYDRRRCLRWCLKVQKPLLIESKSPPRYDSTVEIKNPSPFFPSVETDLTSTETYYSKDGMELQTKHPNERLSEALGATQNTLLLAKA